MEVILTHLLVGATGLLAGLWWGERGRRKDVQWRARVLREDGPAKVVHLPATPEEEVKPIIDSEGRQRLILDLTAAGATLHAAEQEADRLIGAANSIGGLHSI